MPHRSVTCFLLAVALTAVPAVADALITKKSVVEVPGPNGIEVQEETSRTWIGGKLFCEIREASTTVVNLEAKRIFIIDHGAKSYSVLHLPIDFSKIAPEIAQTMEQMVGQMKLQIEVKPTEVEKVIGEYESRKIDVQVTSEVGLTYDIELWVTDDIAVDLTHWKSITRELARLSPPVAADLLSKLADIEGFPVLQTGTMSMMGSKMTTREELVSVELKDPPEGIYLPPADYVERPFDPMTRMSPRKAP